MQELINSLLVTEADLIVGLLIFQLVESLFCRDTTVFIIPFIVRFPN